MELFKNTSAKERLTRAAVTMVTAVAVLGVAACGGGGGTDTVAGTPADGGGDARILLAVSTLANPFFIEMRDGAQEAADAAGVELVVVDAQDDPATQSNQLADALSQNFDIVVLNATDSEAVAPAVKRLNEAEVPVILVDREVNGAEAETYVASDNVELGRLGGEALVEAIGGEGKVAVLRGISGLPSSNERFEGFNTAVDAAEGVEVVAAQVADYDRARGLDVMSNILQANPDIVGVFAENDEMALGAIQALGPRAGNDVFVVGIDGTPDALAAIKEGTMYATIAQQAGELGKAGVDQALAVLDGEDLPETTVVDVKTVTADS
ncbi:substrate-binding domain-containing protein [Cellulomonas fimi]|uniref:D-ribose ABC transporter substrate-binding protein n=1 Tax=Cellulomonas fimi TaxID=1708 RepID=A0A7Y0QGG6_CELFI|nr:substrate-binding domain-containing protein [Cellulomonas fimi]NMR19215.1 D-ribose ABC transporter substrate-binding protein [Cellulomonas fimi]